jgi:hypothetical protein
MTATQTITSRVMSDGLRDDDSWHNHWCSTVLQVRGASNTMAPATNQIEDLVTEVGKL